MQMTFAKRAGKFDELIITRQNGVRDVVQCPKQGIIPHDMVHYAVESCLAQRGFLSIVSDGEAADYATQGGDGEAAIERLVETFQAELWGGRVPATDLIATYTHACEARNHGVAPISIRDVEAIRERLDTLSEAWAALEVGEVMALCF